MLKNQRQFVSRVELEPEHEPHSVTQWLEQPKFVGTRQEESEIRHGNSKRGTSSTIALNENPFLIQGQIKRRLQAAVEFVRLVNKNDGAIRCGKQNCIQVGHTLDCLTKNFDIVCRHLTSDDLRSDGFADSRGSYEKRMVELATILLSSVQTDPNLLKDA
jgi:hypothetical protein